MRSAGYDRDLPVFDHDCTHCEFLGRWAGHDLYIHVGEHEQTLIARYGSDGPQYTSGTVFGVLHLIEGERQHPLAEAFVRAWRLDRVRIQLLKAEHER